LPNFKGESDPDNTPFACSTPLNIMVDIIKMYYHIMFSLSMHVTCQDFTTQKSYIIHCEVPKLKCDSKIWIVT